MPEIETETNTFEVEKFHFENVLVTTPLLNDNLSNMRTGVSNAFFLMAAFIDLLMQCRDWLLARI